MEWSKYYLLCANIWLAIFVLYDKDYFKWIAMVFVFVHLLLGLSSMIMERRLRELEFVLKNINKRYRHGNTNK